MNADADVAQRKRNAVESFMMTRRSDLLFVYDVLSIVDPSVMINVTKPILSLPIET